MTDRRQDPKTAVTGSHPSGTDKAALEAEPNWDRMGQIAKRLMSTPPDRQAVGKAVAPKQGKAEGAGTKGG